MSFQEQNLDGNLQQSSQALDSVFPDGQQRSAAQQGAAQPQQPPPMFYPNGQQTQPSFTGVPQTNDLQNFFTAEQLQNNPGQQLQYYQMLRDQQPQAFHAYLHAIRLQQIRNEQELMQQRQMQQQRQIQQREAQERFLQQRRIAGLDQTNFPVGSAGLAAMFGNQPEVNFGALSGGEPNSSLQQNNQQPYHGQPYPDYPRRSAAKPRKKARHYEDEETDESMESEDDDDDDEDYGRGIAARERPKRAAASVAAQQLKAQSKRKKKRKVDDEDDYDEFEERGHKRGKSYSKREHTPVPTRQGNGTVKSPYVEDEPQETGSDADEDARRQQVAVKNAAVAALLDPEEIKKFDDEVERVISHRPRTQADVPEGEVFEEDPNDKWMNMLFYVKWKRWAYKHCTWDSLTTLSQLGGYKRVLNYCKRMDELERAREVMSREEQELQDVERQMELQLIDQHMELERIVQIRPQNGDVGFLCKWKGLPYSEATWEEKKFVVEMNASDKVEAYQERMQRFQAETGTNVETARSNMYAMRSLQEQPGWLRAGKLRDYQLDGLNWMVYTWSKHHNAILADEMGLGKTIQCVSMIGFLAMELKVMGPFLVVVPLSTVPNWIKEFDKWLPQVNTVVYVGDTKSREVIRKFEFSNTGENSRERPYKFEVIITTYELVLKDAEVLGRIPWNYLVVDEAHRLKNNDSALYQELSQWHFRNKLLVTGTPLQNSIKELWALLHFLEPRKFPSCSQFEAAHSLQDAEGVAQLHAELKPHLLRRVIKDVEKSLPPKKECILRVAMTPLQKQYYKYILSRNYKELNKAGGPQLSLLNIIIELKKCCNHPFLFSTAEQEFRGDDKDLNAVDRLVRTSGKMVLLDKLLKSLKANGHRVLIFSQMVRALDIISDYMRLKGYQHQRLDGSTPATTRHQAMDHFNSPSSTDFAFLLSTRAGGLGINLATADTVIIFDSDWNPQNDLQAMSRAHRIGQTETVSIYRFLTSGSVEEDILHRAKQKMVLDHLVIQRMDTSGRTILDASGGANNAKKMFGKDELQAILRFGAEELFKEDDNKVEQKEAQMLNEDIDSILARAEVVQDSDAAKDGSELLSAFNVATFKQDEDDAAFWNRLIPVAERPKTETEAANQTLGARSTRYRQTDDYDAREATPGSGAGSESEADEKAYKGPGRKRGRPAGRGATAGPPVDGALTRVDVWPADCDIHGVLTGKGRSITKRLSKKDAQAFIRAVKRFGRVERMADIAEEIGPTLQDQSAASRYALWWGLIHGCEKVEKLASEKKADPKDALLDWFGVGTKAQEITAFVTRMSLLAQRIQAAKSPELHYRCEDLAIAQPKWGGSCGWTAEDDQKLLLGCFWYGIGRWEEMSKDERLRLGEKLSLAALQKKESKEVAVEPAYKHLPKASLIETRAQALLRKLQSVHEKGGATSGRPSRATRRRGAPQIDEADKPEDILGEETIVNVKKLRVLQRKGDEMERQKVVEKTRKYLGAVGDRIQQIATTAAIKTKLWAFVSEFTENKLDGHKLERVYLKIKSGKATNAAVHNVGAGVNGDVRENEDGDLVNVEEIEEGEDLKDSKSNALDWETARPARNDFDDLKEEPTDFKQEADFKEEAIDYKSEPLEEGEDGEAELDEKASDDWQPDPPSKKTTPSAPSSHRKASWSKESDDDDDPDYR